MLPHIQMSKTFSTSSPHLSLLLAAFLSFKALTLLLFIHIFKFEEGKGTSEGHSPREGAISKHGILLFVAIEYSSAKVSIPSLIWCLLLDIDLY